MVNSSSPQNSSNQRNKVLPAVCANGRFKVGSRTPGACPITIMSLTMAPPETGGGMTRGQRRQRGGVRHDSPILGGAIWTFGRRVIEWLFLGRARLCRAGRQNNQPRNVALPPKE